MICIHGSTHEYLRRSKLPSTTPSSNPSLLLILPCSLRLRRTPNSLRPVLTLLACVTIPSALCVFTQFPKIARKANTYAAACWPSQPSSPAHISPADNAAQTSSSLRSSRRSARSRCSCHRHIVFGSRRRRPCLCWLCRARRVLTGVRLWRRWRGWGGGRHWVKEHQQACLE